MVARRGLSVLEVSRQKKPGRYADGDGLYLQVSKAGTKSWLLRYMRHGKAREMGLGPVDLVSLAEARNAALAGRKLLLAGIDPIDSRRDERLAAREASAKLTTFKDCAERFIAAQESGWKSAKHAAQWRATLESYAYPVIADLSVSAIDVGLVLRILEPIWTTKTETASRVRGRVEKILDWAKVRKLRDGDNPARWVGHLDQLLPRKSTVAPVRHHKALPYAKLPEFMARLRKNDCTSARALEFTILTAVRTSDTIEGRREELDLRQEFWTVPKERLKGRRGARSYDHVVPLSSRALEILAGFKRTPLLFPGADSETPLSDMAMLELLQGMEGCADVTVHGFRSTFKDWCAEQTAYPNELTEMALAHVVSDKVEAAYRRGDMRDKRRRLMADWATYCASTNSAARKVIAIRAGSQ